MKKYKYISAILVLLLGILGGCTQKDDVQLGSLNTPKQILEELIVGDVKGSVAPFRGDTITPELEEKMTGYAQLLSGREYLRVECMNYEVVGTRKEGIYEETTYHRITLKDDTVLYGICYCLKDENADGLVSFELYTECPW